MNKIEIFRFGFSGLVSPLVKVNGTIRMVEQFTYLGLVTSRDGDVKEDIKGRIVKASKLFGCLRNPILENPILFSPTKLTVYKAIVLAVLFYWG